MSRNAKICSKSLEMTLGSELIGFTVIENSEQLKTELFPSM